MEEESVFGFSKVVSLFILVLRKEFKYMSIERGL